MNHIRQQRLFIGPYTIGPYIGPYAGPLYAGCSIGLLGGSFNPAHAGHVAVSRHALKQLGLNEIWWLVSPQNPLKPADGMAPLTQRLTQARQLAQGHPWLRVTALEQALGTRYTIDTIEKLRLRMPKVRFVWLMGMDNLAQVSQWRRWPVLFRRVPIAVFARPGYSAHRGVRTKGAARFAKARQGRRAIGRLARQFAPPAWGLLENRLVALSATQLRQRRAGCLPRKPHEQAP